MTRRTGIPSLLDIAQELCKAILLFGPIIRRLYPNNTLLLAALETANAACMELAIQLEQVRELGD